MEKLILNPSYAVNQPIGFILATQSSDLHLILTHNTARQPTLTSKPLSNRRTTLLNRLIQATNPDSNFVAMSVSPVGYDREVTVLTKNGIQRRVIMQQLTENFIGDHQEIVSVLRSKLMESIGVSPQESFLFAVNLIDVAVDR